MFANYGPVTSPGSLLRRALAMMLCLVMLLGLLPVTAFASEYKNTLDGWRVDAYWSDLTTDYDWDATVVERRQPKLVFTYAMTEAARDYAPGELSFAVNGIGAAFRDGVTKASDIAAGKEGSDWDYTYNALTDTYTFTNNFSVTAGDAMSGGFELLWTMDARNIVNGYSETLKPTFSVGSETISLKPLTFSFTSERDSYRIEMETRKLNGAEFETADQDYTWYAFTVRYDMDMAARGLYKSSSFVSVTLPSGMDYSGVVVGRNGQTSQLTQVDGNWGFYLYRDEYGDISRTDYTRTEDFRLGFLTDSLAGKTATIRADLSCVFMDEASVATEGPNDKFSASVSRTVQTYGYTSSGYVFELGVWHDGGYEGSENSEPTNYNWRLIASKLFEGLTINHHLHGRLSVEYIETAPATTLNSDVSVVSADAMGGASALKQPKASSDDTSTSTASKDSSAAPSVDDQESVVIVPSESDSETAGSGDAAQQAGSQETEEATVEADAESESAPAAAASVIDPEHIQTLSLIPSDTSGDSGDTGAQPSGDTSSDDSDGSGAANGGADDSAESGTGGDATGGETGGDATGDGAGSSNDTTGDTSGDTTGDTTGDGSSDNDVTGGASGDEEADDTELTDGSDEEPLVDPQDLIPSTYSTFTGTMVLGIDRLTISLVGGDVRPLAASEYDITSVTIPAYETGHNYALYVAYDIEQPFSSYQVYKTGAMSETATTVYLDPGVKAFFMEMDNMEKSNLQLPDFSVNYHFDLEAEMAKAESQRIDTEGVMTTYAFMRFIDGDGVDRIETGEDKYSGTLGPALAARDYALYGQYMFRAHTNMYLREMTFTLAAKTEGADFVDAPEGGFETVVMSSGDIQAELEGPLTKFSIITRLPAGVALDLESPNIHAIGFATTQAGSLVNDFSNNVTYTKYKDSTGATVVVADFDFSETPLESSKITRVQIDYPVTLSYASYLTYGGSYLAETFVLAQDSGMAKVTGDSLRADTSDLDRDGNTAETGAYYGHTIVINDVAREYREYINKTVSSGGSESFEKSSSVKLDEGTGSVESEYTYRLEFGIGANNAKDIVVYDNIEQADGSQFQGVLVAVDTSYAELLGLVPTIYYSTSATQAHDLSAAGWSTTAPADMSTVRSIAVAMDTSGLPNGMLSQGQAVIVDLKMRAPSDESLLRKTAVNTFSACYDIVAAVDGSFIAEKNATSDPSRVVLRRVIGNVTLQKVDADNILKYDADGEPVYAALPGAVIRIYDNNKELVFENDLSMSSAGRLVLKNMEFGTYYWEEVTAPDGYEKVEGLQEFQIDSAESTLYLENHRITGTVTLTKTDADDSTVPPLAGAAYELYDASGDRVKADADGVYSESGTVSRFVTGEDGTITVSGLPWGSYYFKEVTAPVGYQLSSENISFTIDREIHEVAVSASDKQTPTSVVLTKTDAESGEALAGAVYTLERMDADGKWVIYTSQQYRTTNASGEIKLDGLPFGEYRFREAQAPAGYALAEDSISFSISAEEAGKVVNISQTNSRLPGSLALLKTGEDGRQLAGAVYSLFMIGAEEDEEIASDLTTDAQGKTPVVEGLAWGEYYFLETKAPEGYQLSEEKISATIDASTVGTTLTVQASDQRIPGKVTLTKTNDYTDEADRIVLQGAEFSLYLDDGTLVKSGLVTDALGQIKLEDLAWGSYYFQETKAPEGYSINADKIRFSVNAANCEIAQQLTCKNTQGSGQIVVDKQINDQYAPFGVPSFVFKVSGYDMENGYHEWTKILHLGSGETSGSLTFTVPYGNYTVQEVSASRYVATGVQDLGGTATAVSVDAANAQVGVSAAGDAHVKFTNEMSQYESFSHVSSADNIIAAVTKPTSLSVNYIGPAVITSETEDRYTFSDADLVATVYYDDGSSITVPFTSLVLDPPSVTAANNASGSGYTVNVRYTEMGITLSDAFSVVIDLPILATERTVTYNANGGYFDGNTSKTLNAVTYLSGPSGTELQSGEVKEPEHLTMLFGGWYTTQACTAGTEYVFDASQELTEDIQVYAKWEEPVAVFVNGRSFNTQMVEKYGNTAITAFAPHTTVPAAATLAAAVTVEDTSLSNTPIYVWVDNGTMYWWSKDSSPSLAQNAGGMFGSYDGTSTDTAFAALQTFDGAGLDTSSTTSIAALFNWCGDLTTVSGIDEWDTGSVADMSGVFDNCPALTSVGDLSGWETGAATNMGYMFYGCSSLTSVGDLSGWDTSNVTDMRSMFFDCSALTSVGDLDRWNTSKVTNMYGMFYQCSSLTSVGDLGDWDTSSVEDMAFMFTRCTALTSVGDLSGWNTGKVTNMSGMFNGCSKLTSVGDLDGWDTGAVTDMSYMFYNCSALTSVGDLSGWNTGKVTDMSHMFDRCSKLTSVGDLDDWDTSKVTTMQSMFYAAGLTSVGDLSGWNTSRVTDMSTMFYGCSSLTSVGDLDDWDTGAVTNMRYMFHFCSALTSVGNLSGWNTGKVTDMSHMFSNCSSLTSVGDLDGWDTGAVTDMSSMFDLCFSLASVGDLSGWDTGAVTSMRDMFGNCFNLASVGDLGSWDTGAVTDMGFMFTGCSSLASVGDLSGWETGAVTDMTWMFKGCSKLTSVGNLSKWDTGKVTRMASMFYGCSKLTSVGDLSGWNTSKVTDMECMFYGCSSLTSVGDLSGWDTSKVTNMYCMFYKCSSLTSVGDLDNWDTGNVENMGAMFGYCSALTSVGDLSGWDTGTVTSMLSMFRDCYSLTSVGDLSGWSTGKVTNMSGMFYRCYKLTSLALGGWDLSSVTDMSYMFCACEGLASIDLSRWSIPSAATKSYMFNATASTSGACTITCTAATRTALSTGTDMTTSRFTFKIVS